MEGEILSQKIKNAVQTTSFSYDGIKLQYQLNPDSLTTRFNYDADGNMGSFTTRAEALKGGSAEVRKDEALKSSAVGAGSTRPQSTTNYSSSEQPKAVSREAVKKPESKPNDNNKPNDNAKPNESGVSGGQQTTDSEQTFYFHTNGHSDIKSITDKDGHELASYSYDAWGRVISENGTLAYSQPFRYASYYWDSDSSQYYLIARYYQPRLARFISRDPGSGSDFEPQSQNKYVYCENKPITLSDPGGRQFGGFDYEAATQRKVLKVPEAKQAEPEWCWAACIQMAIAYFKGTAPSQAKIVEYVKGSVVKDGATMKEVLKGLKWPKWKLNGTPGESAVKYSSLKAIINKGKLIIAAIYLGIGGTGHAEIIKGYNTSSDFANTGVIFNDPWDGKGHGQSYYNFCYNNSGYTSDWIESIYNIY